MPFVPLSTTHYAGQSPASCGVDPVFGLAMVLQCGQLVRLLPFTVTRAGAATLCCRLAAGADYIWCRAVQRGLGEKTVVQVSLPDR